MAGFFCLERVRPIVIDRFCAVAVTKEKTDVGKVLDITGDDRHYVLTVSVDTVVLRGKRKSLPEPERRDYELGQFFGTRSGNMDNGETHTRYLFELCQFTINFGLAM